MSDLLICEISSDAIAPEVTESDVELTILLPCLNEAETLETCIRRAQAFLQENKVRGEVVVSDNGSEDGSQDIAQQCGARVVETAVRGYGAALIQGSLAAHGKYIIMADSDNSYDLSNLMPFLEMLRAGHHLVMGNRLEGGVKPGAMPWMNRWVGTPVLSSLGRLFFRCPIGDFNCGIRGYSAEAFQKMNLRTTGMEFASEMIVKATLLKLQIAEVPTTLQPDGRTRPPHLRPWRDGWRHLRFMFLYSPRWLFFYPGTLLILLGLAGCALLLPGPRLFHGIGFDVHTLLYAFVSILLGFQFIAFATFTKVFAITEGLLPEDPRLNRVFRWVTLETGLVLGGLLMAFGIGGSIFAVSHWAIESFGALDPEHMLRIVMPAVFSVALGVQIVCSSFFLSILGLRRRTENAELNSKAQNPFD